MRPSLTFIDTKNKMANKTERALAVAITSLEILAEYLECSGCGRSISPCTSCGHDESYPPCMSCMAAVGLEEVNKIINEG